MCVCCLNMWRWEEKWVDILKKNWLYCIWLPLCACINVCPPPHVKVQSSAILLRERFLNVSLAPAGLNFLVLKDYGKNVRVKPRYRRWQMRVKEREKLRAGKRWSAIQRECVLGIWAWMTRTNHKSYICKGQSAHRPARTLPGWHVTLPLAKWLIERPLCMCPSHAFVRVSLDSVSDSVGIYSADPAARLDQWRIKGSRKNKTRKTRQCLLHVLVKSGSFLQSAAYREVLFQIIHYYLSA